MLNLRETWLGAVEEEVEVLLPLEPLLLLELGQMVDSLVYQVLPMQGVDIVVNQMW